VRGEGSAFETPCPAQHCSAARVRNDANKDAKQAEITTAGENRWKKVNLHYSNQIEVSDTHRSAPQVSEPDGRRSLSPRLSRCFIEEP
jgi:hypothetical protein